MSALPNEDLDAGVDAGLDQGTEEPSLRDQLDAAFEEAPSDETVEGEPGVQRSRDELGRFAPEKAPTRPQELRPQTARTQGANQGAQAPAAPQADKAPQSWTPAGREAWNALPPAAKAEIHRREGEMQRVLQEGAGQRQFVDAFSRVVQPYEMFIRSENIGPLEAMDYLMRTAAELRVGTPGSKAALIAEMVNTHGVDIAMLDTLLANRALISQSRQTSQQQAAQQAQFRDPRVDHLLAHQQAQLQAQDAQENAELRDALNGFAATHEFYADVAGLMADLVEVRAANRQPIDMEKIYAQACSLHDGVSQVIAQRRGGTRGGTPRQAVLRARRAAVSVSGDSTPSGGATIPENDDIRSILEAAMDQSR